MNGKRLIVTLAAMVAVLAGVPVASAIGGGSSNSHGQPTILALTAVGSAFTYQGRLTDSGGPANAAYDFQFLLYDTLTGGSQIGATQTIGDLAVTNGLFTTTMDFGATAFDGNARWLEIQVRPGVSTGTYTVLSPRQPITATPYALWAKAAGGFAVPLSAAGATATDPLLDLVQSGAGYAIRATRATTVTTTPAIFGQNDGSGAGVMGLSTYPLGGAIGVVGQATGATGTGGYFKGAVSVELDGPIKVSGTTPTAFVHTVTAGTILAAPDCTGSKCSRIDNPLTNGDPNALLFVILSEPGVGDASVLWVNYANGYWRIWNADGSAMSAGMNFNVLVIKR
jgi:hypothetical protein